ncbi:hypothetical protein [Pseudomonas sp. A-B-19]|uniref:hypothetical protein n=1 Tax=Pseudomonas sp. A-B-19 TaxID=2832405 RepID=UPI001CBFBE49|nr:hypothetical protein [Pseudomonas sp. A-B-19]
MKSDKAMKELRALVLANNPRMTTAELDSLTDIQVLVLVRNSIVWDDRAGEKNEHELEQMRTFLDHLIKKQSSKPSQH